MSFAIAPLDMDVGGTGNEPHLSPDLVSNCSTTDPNNILKYSYCSIAIYVAMVASF